MEYIETTRTLIVDDSDFFASLTADKLEQEHGIATVAATSAAAGLAELDRSSFDCIVSDYDMPEMDGLAFYQEVQKQYGDTPFIILTGRTDGEIATEAVSMGVDDFLRKDAVSEHDGFEVLANRIENVVSRRKTGKKYELVVENIPEFIVQVQSDGTVLAANDAVQPAFDVPASEMVGESLADVLPADVAARWQDHGQQALTTSDRQSFESTVDGRHYDTVVVSLDIGGDSGTYQVIGRDITSRVEYKRELEAATEELELVNRLVRHDIRNDINVISQWADLLSVHLEDDETAQEHLEYISGTSKHIVELTEITGEFVAAISADGGISLEPVSLRSMLAEEIEKCRVSYEDATFSVEETIPAVDVRANEMLVSVFRNLLNNAVQHHDGDEPRVHASVDVEAETVTVTIADDGPGIPEGIREDIFGRGEQGPKSPGTGIGLYLVHTLVSEYGGSVHVEDSDFGGAAFVVTLQRA